MQVEQAVETVCEGQQLTVGPRTTLTSYPGCVHWHWKRGRERGTLEVTFWPETNRLWVSVHANRVGNWTEQAALTVTEKLAAAVGISLAEEMGGRKILL